MPAVTVEHLSKAFGAVHAVNDLSFRIEAGQTVALLGGNGAGKTTTIAMMAGLMIPDGGRVTMLGHDMATDRFRALGRMNFSSPYVDLPGRLTVRENLTVYARLYDIADRKARIAQLAEDLDLTPLLNRHFVTLSAGQKTRVALAKALINDPDVLLLDEPTASLDPDAGDWVRSHLERWQRARGAAILLASHNMAEVERLADTVLMLSAGQLVDQGAPAELIARHGRSTLEEVFLQIARAGRDTAAETLAGAA